MFYIEKLRNFHRFSTVYHLQHSDKRFVNYGKNTGTAKNIYIAIGSSLTYTGGVHMHVRGSSHTVFHGRKILCKKVVRGRKNYVKSCRDEVHFRVQTKFTFELRRSSEGCRIVILQPVVE